ncbi:hypothetical protein [uncultured Dialister sp.]|nr:hypothetical protein [uncultured Dialister sp.]
MKNSYTIISFSHGTMKRFSYCFRTLLVGKWTKGLTGQWASETVGHTEEG